MTSFKVLQCGLYADNLREAADYLRKMRLDPADPHDPDPASVWTLMYALIDCANAIDAVSDRSQYAIYNGQISFDFRSESERRKDATALYQMREVASPIADACGCTVDELLAWIESEAGECGCSPQHLLLWIKSEQQARHRQQAE